MSSSDEDYFGGYGGAGNIDEFLDVNRTPAGDSQDAFTPSRVQRPANYSTPVQPQRRMPIRPTISTSHLHSGPLRASVPRVSSTRAIPQEPSNPEASGSPNQEDVSPIHQEQRSSSVVLQSPSMSSNSQASHHQEQTSPSIPLRSPSMSGNSQRGSLSPRVDSDMEGGSFPASQQADETSAVVIPSIESPGVEDNEESQSTLDHGRSQVVSDDPYNASPQRSNRTPQQPARQHPSIFGAPINLSVRPARNSTHLQTPQASSQRKQPEPIAVESDSDDDCVITAVRPARPGNPRIKDPAPIIKEESTPDSPNNLSIPKVANGSSDRGMTSDYNRESSPTEEEMLAAQAAMIPPASDIPRPMNQGRKRRRENMAYPEEQVEIDAAMQVNEDDDDWMHAQEDDDDDSQEEYENLLIQQSALKKDLRRKGTLSIDESAELVRLNNILSRMDRLRSARARGAQDDAEDEDSLFIPETHRRIPSVVNNGEGPSSRHDQRYETMDDDAGFASMLQEEFDRNIDSGSSNKRKSKKTRRAPAKNAREYHAREEERRIEKERARSRKKKANGSGKGGKAEKANAGRKGKGKGKEKEKKSKKGSVKVDRNMRDARFMGPRGRQDEIGQLILDDLMNADAIGDRLQDPIFNCGPEPEIGGLRTKASQLQQLFANIPEGSSKTKGKSDKAKLLQASRSFGYAQVKAVNGKWLVKGMISTLYHHQLLGAQWMVERELSSEPPHGGLLADSMGLGKTVQTLACMVGNPPTEEDEKRGVTATLIVVPSSVVRQWLEEIEIHVDCKKIFPKVMQYKASMNIPESVLKELDIVVTTYTEVMKQFPFPDEKGREDIANFGYKRWWKNAHDNLGPLHRINWRRVVLDEAHAIKNNAVRTSLACQNLKSVYRWCLTGTPLLNKLDE